MYVWCLARVYEHAYMSNNNHNFSLFLFLSLSLCFSPSSFFFLFCVHTHTPTHTYRLNSIDSNMCVHVSLVFSGRTRLFFFFCSFVPFFVLCILIMQMTISCLIIVPMFKANHANWKLPPLYSEWVNGIEVEGREFYSWTRANLRIWFNAMNVDVLPMPNVINRWLRRI